MTLPISTARLLLRRFTYADGADLLEMVSHPSVAIATPEIVGTQDGVRQYIEMQNGFAPFEQDKCFDLAIQRREDGKVIGILTLVAKAQQQGAIGWALTVEYRRHGYALEAAGALLAYAFTELGLHRVESETEDNNRASWRLMERLGMTREARLRETMLRDGEWQDTLVYGILADEWRRDLT